jgi:hypothetical protein
MTVDIDKIGLALSLAIDRVESLPPQFWFGIGFTIAGIPATYLIIERYKKHRIKKDLEKLGGHIQIVLVAVAAFVFSAADFFITVGTSLNALGGFLPFWVSHGAAIMAGAVVLREFTKAIKEKRLRDAAAQVDPAILEKLTRQANPQSYPSDAGLIPPLPIKPRSTDLFS